MTLNDVILIVAAFLTAGISGAVGMGGGVALIAVMAAILPAALVVPIHGVVQLASNGTRIIAFWDDVRWKFVAWFFPMCIIGIAIATMLWNGEKMGWFKPVIGAFIIFFLLYRKYKPTLRQMPIWTFGPLGTAAGFLAIFIGATGPFLAPFFLRDDLSKEEVVGTKAACQAFMHALKIPAFLALEFAYADHVRLWLPLVIAVFAGTFFGKAVLSKISNKVFVYIFHVVLIAVAIHLIGSSILAQLG